mgnify:CR=1 FL=1
MKRPVRKSSERKLLVLWTLCVRDIIIIEYCITILFFTIMTVKIYNYVVCNDVPLVFILISYNKRVILIYKSKTTIM